MKHKTVRISPTKWSYRGYEIKKRHKPARGYCFAAETREPYTRWDTCHSLKSARKFIDAQVDAK